MKIRTMLGLAAAGGLLYMHRKRGGEWTLDSVRDSLRQLWDGIQRGAERAKREAQDKLREGAHHVDKVARTMNETANNLNGRR